MSIGPGHIAVLSGIIFAVGAWGLVSRRDAFGMLVSLAILLLAPVIAFAGFTATGGGAQGPPHGEVVALAAVVVCVAETLVGASLVALLRRRLGGVDTDGYDRIDSDPR